MVSSLTFPHLNPVRNSTLLDTCYKPRQYHWVCKQYRQTPSPTPLPKRKKSTERKGNLLIKVKVKFTLEQATKTHRGRTGIALFFL